MKNYKKQTNSFEALHSVDPVSLKIILIREFYRVMKNRTKYGEGVTKEDYKTIYNVINKEVGDEHESTIALLDICSQEEDVTFRGNLAHLLIYTTPHIDHNDSRIVLIDEKLDDLYNKEEIPFIKRALSLPFAYFDLDKTKRLLEEQVKFYGENTEAGYEAKIILKEIKEKGIKAISSY